MHDEIRFEVRCEVPAGAVWRDWEAFGVAFAREAPARALALLADEVQDRMLDEVCGPRWRPVPGLEAPFGCPGCGCSRDFARKGRRSRPRRLDTACGVVRLRLAQVRCRGCGRVFAPLLELLGIPAGVRRTDRLAFALAELGGQVSYARAGRLVEAITSSPSSAGRAHAAARDIAARLGELTPAGQQAEVVLLDGTGVRAGPRRLGVTLNLAIALNAKHGPFRRRVAETTLLAATVDEPWAAMGDRLAGMPAPKLVIVDGEVAVTAVARRLWPEVPVQRCLWHLRHSTQWAFYRDKIKGPQIRGVMDRVNGLLDDVIANRPPLARAQQQLDELVVLLDNSGLEQGALHLRLARDQAFTFLDQDLAAQLPGLGHRVERGSGVIERAMRDLNARTDIHGVRWSIPGIRRVVNIALAQRFDHPSWTALRDQLQTPNTTRFALGKVNA